ncbi:MAG: T9SS type A sorting domain-containing protein [Bacteroidales bacterium]
MKKIFTLTTVLIVLLFTSYQSFAKTIEMNLYNLVQVNETEFRIDLRIKNTTADPANTGSIAIAAWAIKFNLNASLNNGFTNAIVASYVGNSQLTNPSENFPTNANTSYSTAGNFFQSYSSTATVDQPVTLLDHANWVIIGTFKLQCKNAAVLRNFLSFAPNIAFTAGTFTGVNECTWYDDGNGNGAASILRADAVNTPVTVDRTLTLPNNANTLCSYFFSGTGNWSLATNWNKVAAASNGRNTIPTAASSASIGVYTTANPPVATLGACTFDAAAVNISLTDLNIKSTSSLIISAGKQMTVTGNLVKDNAAATALTLKSTVAGTASLKNNTAGVNATIELYIPAWVGNNGWHLLSSPVASQVIATGFIDATPANYDFFKYDNTVALCWKNYKSGGFTTFTPGAGYLASYFTASTHSFSGVMNAGDLNPTVTFNTFPGTGWNLLGNPYACAIDGGLVTKTNVDGSVYVLNGATNVYGAWNGTTGTNGFNGEIPAMQGFFVHANGAGSSVTIPATAKKHSSNGFFKSTLENQLKLNVQSPNNTTDETVIYFKNDNLNGVDVNDALQMPSGNPLNTQIYSYINSDKYCIDALAEFTAPISVTVGFEPKVDGNFTITAGEIQSFNAASTIILQDLKTGTTQNLRTNPTYNFAATTTDLVNRFNVLFDLSPNGINKVNATNNSIFSFENSIYFTSKDVKSVSVYNMLGQEVLNIQQPTSNLVTINQASGYYTVRVITNSNVYSQKVYIK